MPPHADPALEKRILDAAGKLWRRGGAKALTMRAVAAAARTTTPTLYGRFRDKDEIMRALRMHIREELYAILLDTDAPREICDAYMNFALGRPHEYRLLMENWTSTRDLGEPTPSSSLMKQRMAKWFGGEPEDYAVLTMALWAMLHGMVSLALMGKADKNLQGEMRSVFLQAFDILTAEKPASKKFVTVS